MGLDSWSRKYTADPAAPGIPSVRLTLVLALQHCRNNAKLGRGMSFRLLA